MIIRILILSLVAVILSLNLGLAQVSGSSNSQNTKEDNNKPEIVFEKLVYDFGKIPLNGDGSCEFDFTNKGKTPLRLSNVKSTCGCTVPSWSKEPINKNEKGSIKVMYNTSRVGVFEKSITVYSNAKNNINLLTIKGKVEKETNNSPIEDKSILSTDN